MKQILMPTQVTEKLYTLEEYFELEYTSETRHVFVDGKISPMAAYTSKNHGRIIHNLDRILGAALMSSGYEIFPGDRLLYIPACNKTYYPDLILLPVDAATMDYKGKMEAELYPVVVVEVLSDSTEEDDRTEKWRCYQMIESLRQYVLISQKLAYVESYYRQAEQSKWLYTSVEGKDAGIDIHGYRVPLADLYQRVVF